MVKSSQTPQNNEEVRQEPYDTEDTEKTFDAKVMIEEIKDGEIEAPEVSVESDYEASKQFSQGKNSDVTENSPQAKAPFKTSQLNENHEAESTGDPNAFRKMAKEVNPQNR
ncbi:MAG: hypothetical protein HC769_19980 [Cyanobacteria bacterium CRU_2_1]|nr:hypothetical protein [Cyanobacteria bacterium CRU_2_1]